MSDEHEIHELESRLAAAHSAAPAPNLADDWQAGVMRSVREQALPSDAAPSEFERVVRVVALAAGFFALVCAGLLVASGVSASGLYFTLGADSGSILEMLLVF